MEDQPRLLARMPLELRHAQHVDADVARHIGPQRPAHHLAAEEVDYDGEKQPAFIGGDVGGVAPLDLVGVSYIELPIKQIEHKRKVVLAVGRDLEPALALGPDAVQLHELLHSVLAHSNAACEQFFPSAWPAVAASRLGVDGLDVHQQRVIAQVAALDTAGPANKVLVKPGHADLQHPAQHRDRPHPPVTLDGGVLHFAAFAKYAFSGSMLPRSMACADHFFPECRAPFSRAPTQHAAG